MNFKFKTPDIPLFDIGKAKRLFGNEITRALDTMADETVKNVVMEAPKASGQLINHVKSERVNALSARAFVDVDYGVVVEKGRRRNKRQPPIDALINWMKRSAQGSAYYNALKSSYKRITYKSAAYVLARSIGKKGIKANPFFHRGVKKTESVYLHEAEKLMDRIMKGIA
jgi:hypothetical protein